MNDFKEFGNFMEILVIEIFYETTFSVNPFKFRA